MRTIRKLYKDENAMGTICCGVTGSLAGTLLLPANIACLTLPCCCMPNMLALIISVIGGGMGAVVGCMTDTFATICGPILAILGSAGGGSTGAAAVKAIRI